MACSLDSIIVVLVKPGITLFMDDSHAESARAIGSLVGGGGIDWQLARRSVAMRTRRECMC
jgi:hypothetical protein